jgi:outer membrane protein OmpA-like peptidoglycan-associated protein
MGIVLLGGCATANPPQELVDARASYSAAEQGPAKTYKMDQLHEARTELDQAEAAFKDDPDAENTKTMAYLANRKAQLAAVEGATAEAIDQTNQTNGEASRTQAAGLRRAQGELSNTRQALVNQAQALDSQTAALQSETDARLRADARTQDADARTQDADARAKRAEAMTKDALDKLALASVPVKQEARGLVITLPGNILFASNKSTLLSTAQDKLNQVANVLKDEEQEHKIVVEGYTDSRGSNELNDRLSKDRADSVRQYLVDRGVTSGQIQASGLGSSRPVADNASAEGRADNRRVEIVVSAIEPK